MNQAPTVRSGLGAWAGSGEVAEFGHDGVARLVVLGLEEVVVSLDTDLKTRDVLIRDREWVGYVLVPVAPSCCQNLPHETSVWVEVEVGAHTAHDRDDPHHVEAADVRHERDRAELNGPSERQSGPDTHPRGDLARMERLVGERHVLSCRELDAVPAFFPGGHWSTFFDSHMAITCFLFKLRLRSGGGSSDIRRRSTELELVYHRKLTKSINLCIIYTIVQSHVYPIGRSQK